MNTSDQRLRVQDFAVGMKVRWRKNGITDSKIFEVVKIEQPKGGRTVIHIKDGTGRVILDHHAGNRYIVVE